jgi:hypothetical protein
VVKDLAGSVIADATVHHIYTFDGPTIVSMEIQSRPASDPRRREGRGGAD